MRVGEERGPGRKAGTFFLEATEEAMRKDVTMKDRLLDFAIMLAVLVLLALLCVGGNHV